MAEFKTVMGEFQRLCFGRKCGSCPIGTRVYNETASYCYCSVWVKNHPEEAERIIMRWAAEHPIMTNGMKFKEVFGNHVVWETNEDMEAWFNKEYHKD